LAFACHLDLCGFYCLVGYITDVVGYLGHRLVNLICADSGEVWFLNLKVVALKFNFLDSNIAQTAVIHYFFL